MVKIIGKKVICMSLAVMLLSQNLGFQLVTHAHAEEVHQHSEAYVEESSLITASHSDEEQPLPEEEQQKKLMLPSAAQERAAGAAVDVMFYHKDATTPHAIKTFSSFEEGWEAAVTAYEKDRTVITMHEDFQFDWLNGKSLWNGTLYMDD